MSHLLDPVHFTDSRGLSVLKFVAAFVLSFTFVELGRCADPGTQACRCLYGDQCWPNDAEFAKLASQVSRPLIHPRPLAHPCYVSLNSTSCATALSSWTNATWRSTRPGEAQIPNFETFMYADRIGACYMETSLGLPCDQGNVPVVGVAARTVGDIQHAVKFAGKHNLRVVIKNTGHDFLGRSNGRGSFMIWTHHMKGRSIHETWTPTGAPSDKVYEYVLTVQAGVQWQEAYATANNAGRMIVGGISPGGSVGAAGGWLLGGGHSALSPTYGLGVDNVLEISMVTAHGEHISANAYQHPDLFWALRGGGGGTFGVVTSMTYRTYPIVPTTLAFLVALVKTPEPNIAMKAAFTELVRISTNLTDQGWGGYAQFSPSANATPYFNFVRSLTAKPDANSNPDDKLVIEILGVKEYPSFWDLYRAHMTDSGSGHVGYNLELGSWLMPRTVLEKNYAQAADILIASPGLSYELVAGGAVSRVDPSSTGLNPAWRKAGAHVVSGITWPDGSSSAHIEGLRGELEKRLKTVRALAPESGAYFNEASMFEPSPQVTFFGDHYAKLKSIKRVYDPNDLFIVVEGVGADAWDKELKCRL